MKRLFLHISYLFFDNLEFSLIRFRIMYALKNFLRISELKLKWWVKLRDGPKIICPFWIFRQISNQNKFWLVKNNFSSVYIGSQQFKTNKRAGNLNWTSLIWAITQFDSIIQLYTFFMKVQSFITQIWNSISWNWEFQLIHLSAFKRISPKGLFLKQGSFVILKKKLIAFLSSFVN